MDVVPSGDIQDRFAELLTAMINAKNGCEIAQLDVGAAIIRVVRKAVGDCARTRSTQTRRVLVVGVIKNSSTGLLDELSKNFFDGSKIGIKIEMLLFDI